MEVALQNRANSIKDLVRQQPERGAELLLDFARLYAATNDIEDEVLLLQYELASESAMPEDKRHHFTTLASLRLLLASESAMPEEKKVEIVVALESLAQKVVDTYDEDLVRARLSLEKQMAEAAKKRRQQESVVLVAENIQKTYKSSRFTLQADNIALRLGEIAGLVGENATGKTTLFRVLAGDLAQDKGQVRYPLFDPKNKLNWSDLKLKIAYVPQELPAWEGSLLENLKFEAARHGILGKDNALAVDYIVQRLGLALHLDKGWQELSGGYKLRFALAKALVWKTQLLILDEPLAFLDIKTQATVLNDLRDLAKSLRHPIAILVSSQHLHEIEAVADQMLFMREGHLENLGKTKDIGKDREYNLFELSCDASFKDFAKMLKGLTDYDVWSNELNYFVPTPLDIDSEKLLQYLATQPLKLTYFRDISTSVKAKFYENAR